MCKTGDIAWYCDDAIERRFIVIVPSSSYYCITAASHYRYRTIAASPPSLHPPRSRICDREQPGPYPILHFSLESGCPYSSLSHLDVLVDGAIMAMVIRWGDDDAMVIVQWGNGDDAITTTKRCSIAPSLSHHHAIDFFAHALFEENGARITL